MPPRRSPPTPALVVVIAAALAIGAAGCGSTAEREVTPAYEDIQRIFDQSCGGVACHRAAEGLAPRSVDLAPGTSYQALVGRPSAAAPARLLVAPGAPDDSYLLCTIDPACEHRVGALMPPGARLTPDTIEAVRRWIAGGAPPARGPVIDAGVDLPPRFAGLERAAATGERTVDLSWQPAFDRTPPARLRYRVYVATAPGAQDFAAPRVTVTGVTAVTLAGLAAATRYHVVVRAVDEADHEDDNRVERTVDTPDLTAPEFGGVGALTEPTPGTLRVAWTEATDNATPAAAIRYRVYLATAAGGQDLAAPVASVVGVTSATVAVQPSTTYHVVVRATDGAGNEDPNLVERSLVTADTVAPSFAGVATATGVPSAVALTWAAATDDTTPAAGLVYLATTSGAQDLSTPTYVSPPGATQLSASGLAPSRTYYFVVRARDAAGNVDGNTVERSATTPANVDVTPPVFAGAASATAIGASAIRLAWAAGSDNVTLAGNLVYRIYRATAPGGQQLGTATYVTLPGATSFVATGLAPTTRYWFVVRAFDQAGNQDGNTVEVDAITPADTTAPTFAGVTGAATVSSSAIALAWNPASDDITPAAALVYDVYRARAAGGQDFAAPTYTSAPGASGLVAGGLDPLTTYHFVVRARDAAGNRDGNGAERTATTSADITPPVFAGVGAVAATGAPGELDVSWPAATDAVTTQDHLRYEVYASTLPDFQTFLLPTAISGPGATSVRLTGLLAGTTYFVCVRARDEAGNLDGNVREVAAATTPDTIRPVFAGLTSAMAKNPSQARLTWSAATDDFTPQAQLVYDVYVAATPGGQDLAGAPFATSPPGATSFVVGGLAAATTHHFVVRARDVGGNRDLNTVERSAALPAFTVRLSADVQPIFSAACATAGCHEGAFPAIGVDLSTAMASRQALVDQPSSQFNLVLRVAPGESGASYLMFKVLGEGPSFEGDPMPPPPDPLLTPAQIAKIRTWIDEGAVDN